VSGGGAVFEISKTYVLQYLLLQRAQEESLQSSDFPVRVRGRISRRITLNKYSQIYTITIIHSAGMSIYNSR
jgi:hypothetical protein